MACDHEAGRDLCVDGDSRRTTGRTRPFDGWDPSTTGNAIMVSVARLGTYLSKGEEEKARLLQRAYFSTFMPLRSPLLDTV